MQQPVDRVIVDHPVTQPDHRIKQIPLPLRHT